MLVLPPAVTTFRITTTCWGEFPAVADFTPTSPVYCPVRSPVAFTVTSTKGAEAPAVLVALVGDTLSQLPPDWVLTSAVQFIDPSPLFATANLWDASLVLPSTAVNSRPLCPRSSTGPPPVISSDAGRVCVSLVVGLVTRTEPE